MKTGIKIYVAEIVYSEPSKDGVRRLRSIIEGYASKEEAISRVRHFEATGDIRLRIGQVVELEQYVEVVE